MNRKIFAISVMALFLVVCLGAVSAENSIDVKAIGDFGDDVLAVGGQDDVLSNDTLNNDTDDVNDTDGEYTGTGEGVFEPIGGVDAVVYETPDKDVNDTPVKKENETHQTNLKSTGFPLVVLIVAVFAAIFIPVNRRK